MEKLTLEGDVIRLEPLAARHLAGIREAIADGDLWKLFYTFVPHPDDVDGFLNNAEAEYVRGEGVTFAIVDRASDRIIGSTRFMKANPAHRRVEIGFTFLGRQDQRTAVNTEAKLLMLTHAFDTLGLNRVEFLTDYFNAGSRAAILRLGAKEEGLLRSHMVMPDGRVRDSVVYSIVRSEWPGVRRNLTARLASRMMSSRKS